MSSTSSIMKALIAVLATSVTFQGALASPLPELEVTVAVSSATPYIRSVINPLDSDTVTVPIKRDTVDDDTVTISVPTNVTRRELSERKDVPSVRLGTNTAPSVTGSSKGGFSLNNDPFGALGEDPRSNATNYH